MLMKSIALAIIVFFIGLNVTPIISSSNINIEFEKKSTDLSQFNPFKNGWKYRKMITVNHYEVTGDLYYFPVLISSTDIDLRNHAQNNGDDILFMDDKGLANKLNHEIEYFNGNTGEIVSWVCIPSIKNDVDTVFYMYYGNHNCNDQENIADTWDSNYVGVWHMNDDTINTISDSSIYDNDGLKTSNNNPNEVSGIIGKCQNFDGDSEDEWINCGSDYSLDRTDKITMEYWINIDSTSGEYYPIYKNFAYLIIQQGFPNWNCAVPYYFDSNGKRYYPPLAQEWTPTIGAWYYMVAVYSDNGNWKFYIDALEKDLDYHEKSETGTDSTDLYIGGTDLKADRTINGRLDEVRISNIDRSSTWITTSYKMMKYPSIFISFGLEEPKNNLNKFNLLYFDLFQHLIKKYPLFTHLLYLN